MPDAYFALVSEETGASRYAAALSAGGDTAGPWDPCLQHGGPPSALLIHAAERVAAGGVDDQRTDLIASRYAAEFVGPVPVGEVAVRAEVVRAARSAMLVSATLVDPARDRVCLQARIWLVRDADTSAIARTDPAAAPPANAPGLGGSFPYADSIEWRSEHGALHEPGPAAMWARPCLPVLADVALSGLQRVALVGDSASGMSSELDWTQWSFLNVDLDVHLARPVQGEWVHLDAVTQLGGHGAALTRSTVSDTAGIVGCTAQTLVLAPRPTGRSD